MFKVIRLYTLNLCSLLYVNYTAIKLLKYSIKIISRVEGPEAGKQLRRDHGGSGSPQVPVAALWKAGKHYIPLSQWLHFLGLDNKAEEPEERKGRDQSLASSGPCGQQKGSMVASGSSWARKPSALGCLQPQLQASQNPFPVDSSKAFALTLAARWPTPGGQWRFTGSTTMSNGTTRALHMSSNCVEWLRACLC